MRIVWFDSEYKRLYGGHCAPCTQHSNIKSGSGSAERSYYANLVADVLDRTETAMTQNHCFKVMELALQAEATATRLDLPAERTIKESGIALD